MAWGIYNKLKNKIKKGINKVTDVAKKAVKFVADNTDKVGNLVNLVAPGIGDKFKKGVNAVKDLTGYGRVQTKYGNEKDIWQDDEGGYYG